MAGDKDYMENKIGSVGWELKNKDVLCEYEMELIEILCEESRIKESDKLLLRVKDGLMLLCEYELEMYKLLGGEKMGECLEKLLLNAKRNQKERKYMKRLLKDMCEKICWLEMKDVMVELSKKEMCKEEDVDVRKREVLGCDMGGIYVGEKKKVEGLLDRRKECNYMMRLKEGLLLRKKENRINVSMVDDCEDRLKRSYKRKMKKKGENAEEKKVGRMIKRIYEEDMRVIYYEDEKMFNGCSWKKGLRFDYYMIVCDVNGCSNEIVIEMDGLQHFKMWVYDGGDEEKYYERMLRDMYKEYYCYKNNIYMLRLHYKDKNKEKMINDYVSDIILCEKVVLIKKTHDDYNENMKKLKEKYSDIECVWDIKEIKSVVDIKESVKKKKKEIPKIEKRNVNMEGGFEKWLKEISI
jgi:hypothetical protein